MQLGPSANYKPENALVIPIYKNIMQDERNQYDVVIVGGGLVGISLALALRNLPLRIALLEASSSEIPTRKSEGRALALSYTSSQILAGIGIWPMLTECATVITQVHISNRGHFGLTRISAQQERVPALGYVIPALQLASVLNNVLTQASEITFLANSKVFAMNRADTAWQLQLQTPSGNQTICTQLVVAADGTQSTIRELQAIPTVKHDYQQRALVTTVTTTQTHKNIAYERFIAGGAIALLPHRQAQCCTLIWSDSNPRVEHLLALSETGFLKQLQEYFGYRLGHFTTVGQRYTYPLQLVQAEKWFAEGLVLIGNAAHTLHPIAAQGFNLGLRDVAFLAQTITDAVQGKKNIASLEVLINYAKLREQDQIYYKKLTHSLVYFFAEDFLPLTCARNFYMMSLELLPWLKHRLAQRLLGTQGYSPKLARGVPL